VGGCGRYTEWVRDAVGTTSTPVLTA